MFVGRLCGGKVNVFVKVRGWLPPPPTFASVCWLIDTLFSRPQPLLPHPHPNPSLGPDAKHPSYIDGAYPVVYECSPWTGCAEAQAGTCPYMVTQQGLFYRLELFKTANRGWGVRCWDMIPFGA